MTTGFLAVWSGSWAAANLMSFDFTLSIEPINSDRHPSSCCYDHTYSFATDDRRVSLAPCWFLTGLPADSLGCHLWPVSRPSSALNRHQKPAFRMSYGITQLDDTQIAPSLG